MGAPSGGSLVGKQVAKLPVPEHNDQLPWPYFAVEPAVRAAVVTGQRTQTVTLGPLGAAAPVVAPRPPAPPMQIPVSAKRVAGPAAASIPPRTQPPAPTTPRTPAHVSPGPQPATMGVAVGATATPRRTAGPQTASGVSKAPPPAGPPPMVSYPSSVGSYATAPSSAAPVPSVAAAVPAPMRGAVGGTPATQRRAVAGVEGLGTAALVLGLLGILIPLAAGIPAIICGHVALRRVDPVWTPERLKRRAQWGLALGYLSSLFWLGYLFVVR